MDDDVEWEDVDEDVDDVDTDMDGADMDVDKDVGDWAVTWMMIFLMMIFLSSFYCHYNMIFLSLSC